MKEESKEELQELVLAHLDERLSDGEFEELEAWLARDPEAQREYVKLARLDSVLRDDAGIDEIPMITPQRAKRREGELHYFPLAAIAAMIVVSLVWFWPSPSDEGSPLAQSEVEGLEAMGIAVVSEQVGAVWGKGSELSGKGISLGPGKLHLEKGLAQIDFFGGASISLSGPAELELISAHEAVLHRGMLTADVPPAARGFKILSGEVMIEDLGTRFGLAVREGKGADVVVFDGEVKAHQKDGEAKSLFGGQSAHLANGEAILQAPDAEGIYPSIKDVFQKAEDRDQLRYAKWKEARPAQYQDSRLIAYYDFEGLTPASRRLSNRATEGLGSELDGGIVGARVASGRWPGKTALDFRQEGDRVRFQIPGEFEALTIYAWVRIDALDRRINSLFLTEYYDPGEFHWQILGRGVVHFATSPKGVEDIENESRQFFSEKFWDSGKSGLWFFLATTVDPDAGVLHYINGEEVGMSGGANMEKELPTLRIGKADLGNWSKPVLTKSPLRALNGRIDEFALYREALTAQEIRSFYELGKP